MNGIELLAWRRERNVKQADLAKALGVSRNTLVRWERGHHRIPLVVHSKLEKLAYTLMPKPEAPIPEKVDRESAPLRSDLDLFGKASRDGIGGFGTEHPAVLLPDLLPKKAGVVHHIPWAILESPEFIAALQRKRERDKNNR